MTTKTWACDVEAESCSLCFSTQGRKCPHDTLLERNKKVHRGKISASESCMVPFRIETELDAMMRSFIPSCLCRRTPKDRGSRLAAQEGERNRFDVPRGQALIG